MMDLPKEQKPKTKRPRAIILSSSNKTQIKINQNPEIIGCAKRKFDEIGENFTGKRQKVEKDVPHRAEQFPGSSKLGKDVSQRLDQLPGTSKFAPRNTSSFSRSILSPESLPTVLKPTKTYSRKNIIGKPKISGNITKDFEEKIFGNRESFIGTSLLELSTEEQIDLSKNIEQTSKDESLVPKTTESPFNPQKEVKSSIFFPAEEIFKNVHETQSKSKNLHKSIKNDNFSPESNLGTSYELQGQNKAPKSSEKQKGSIGIELEGSKSEQIKKVIVSTKTGDVSSKTGEISSKLGTVPSKTGELSLKTSAVSSKIGEVFSKSEEIIGTSLKNTPVTKIDENFPVSDKIVPKNIKVVFESKTNLPEMGEDTKNEETISRNEKTASNSGKMIFDNKKLVFSTEKPVSSSEITIPSIGKTITSIEEETSINNKESLSKAQSSSNDSELPNLPKYDEIDPNSYKPNESNIFSSPKLSGSKDRQKVPAVKITEIKEIDGVKKIIVENRTKRMKIDWDQYIGRNISENNAEMYLNRRRRKLNMVIQDRKEILGENPKSEMDKFPADQNLPTNKNLEDKKIPIDQNVTTNKTLEGQNIPKSNLVEKITKSNPQTTFSKEKRSENYELKEIPKDKKIELTEKSLENTILTEKSVEHRVLTENPLKDTVLTEKSLENKILTENPLENTDLAENLLEDTVLTETPLEETVLPEEPLENTVLPEEPLENAVLPEEPLENAVLPEEPLENTVQTEKSPKDNVPKEKSLNDPKIAQINTVENQKPQKTTENSKKTHTHKNPTQKTPKDKKIPEDQIRNIKDTKEILEENNKEPKPITEISDRRQPKIPNPRKPRFGKKETYQTQIEDAKQNIKKSVIEKNLAEQIQITIQTDKLIQPDPKDLTDKKNRKKVLLKFFEDQKFTVRMMQRVNFVLKTVKEEKIIVDTWRLIRGIRDFEAEEGAKALADKKSINRLLLKLSEYGLIKYRKAKIKSNNIEKNIEVVCDPSHNDDEIIMSAILEEAKVKFVLTGKDESPDEPEEKTDEVEDLYDKDIPKEKPHYKFNKNLAKSYGYCPKLGRCRKLHELLFYLINKNNLEPITDHHEIDKILAPYGGTSKIFEDCTQAPLFSRDISWKMFLPPIKTSQDYPKGWIMISDILLRLPLSILASIFQIQYEIPNLTEFMTHPVKKHILVQNLPSSIKRGLFFAKKISPTLIENLRMLCYLGLIQFGPQKTKNRDQIYIYLNKKASLYNTVKSASGYHQVSELDYKKHEYTFETFSDLEQFWYDMWSICANTPLGHRNAVAGEYILLDNPLTKKELLESLQPRLPDEAIRLDIGNIPGDRRGAAGFDSCLFAHLKRNWSWLNSMNTIHEGDFSKSFIEKDEKEKGSLKINVVEKQTGAVKKQTGTKCLVGNLKTGSSGKIGGTSGKNDCSVKNDGSSAKLDETSDKLGGSSVKFDDSSAKIDETFKSDGSPSKAIVSETSIEKFSLSDNLPKIEDHLPKKPLFDKKSALGFDLPKFKIRPKQKFREVPLRKPSIKKRNKGKDYDEIDRICLSNMKKLRTDWSELEDHIILLCAIASDYLCPNYRKQSIERSVVRDVLHKIVHYSNDKTSLAVHRRVRYILKHPNTSKSFVMCLEEIKHCQFVEQKFGRIKKKYQKNLIPNEILRIAFVELVIFLSQKFSRFHQKEHYVIPDTVDELRNKYDFVCQKKGLVPKAYFSDVSSVYDIECDTVRSVIHSSLCSSKDKTSWAFQLFKIYQQYPETLLRAVISKVRLDQLASMKKAALLKIRSTTSSILQSPFKLSIKYQLLLQSTQFRYEGLLEANSFIQKFIPWLQNLNLNSGISENFDESNYGNIENPRKSASEHSKNHENLVPVISENPERTRNSENPGISFSENSENPENSVSDNSEHLGILVPGNSAPKNSENTGDSISKKSVIPSNSNSKNSGTFDTTNFRFDITFSDHGTSLILPNLLQRLVLEPVFEHPDQVIILDPILKQDTTYERILNKYYEILQAQTNLALGETRTSDDDSDEENVPHLGDTQIGDLEIKHASRIGFHMTRAALLDRNEKNNVQHMHDYFVVQASKVFLRPMDVPEALKWDQSLKKLSSDILKEIKSKIVLPEGYNKSIYEEMKDFFCGINLVLDDFEYVEKIRCQIHNSKELGMTSLEIKNIVPDSKNINLTYKNVIEFLEKFHIIIRVGTICLRFVHFDFKKPWVTHADKILRLEKEKMSRDLIPKTKWKGKHILKSSDSKDRKIKILVAPWVRLDGSLNRRVLDRWLGKLVSASVEAPGIRLQELIDKLNLLKPTETMFLIETLVKIGSVRLIKVKKPKVTLFSEVVDYDFDNADILDDPNEVLVEPTIDAFLNFAAFIGNKNYSFNFID